jgi:signal transduction histidine kinase/CheY-like chemotaxis protein
MAHRSQSSDALDGQLRIFERLYQLTGRLSRSTTLDEVCNAAVEAIVDLSGAQRASVLIFDEQGVMRFKAWRGLSDAYRAAVDGHSPWTADAQDPTAITVEDVLHDASVGALRDVIAGEGIRALAFVPVVYDGRLLGKFMLYHDAPYRFASDELALAATIAHHVGFAVARAQADASLEAALQRERLARADADAARAEAERANAAKDEFLAMLAHELRNPLGVVTTALAVVQGSQPKEAAYERSLAAIRRQSEHLARLLDDLLDVARITRGDVQLQVTPVDLRGIVELSIETQRHRIEAKRQQLDVSLPDRPLTVMGDSLRLQQVLGNILHNASKYTQADGRISVVLDVDAGVAVVRVRDNGSGIEPDRLQWIFELFNQANPTLSRTDGGLGIGLTVAKRLMALHGGDVRALSEGLGRGTEFLLRLPLAVEGAAAPTLAPADVHARRKRILVIEDNDDGREMLVTALQLFGHDASGASTGGEGLRMAVQLAPDVVLVDIGLPDIEGYEVARALRGKLAPGARLIAVTGYGRSADRARSEQAGFHAHLLKPVDPRRLLSALQTLS